MRIHLIKEETIREYCIHHSAGLVSFQKWLIKLKSANWQQPGDIKSTYNSADIIGRGSNRVIFDIEGNNHRMICKYVFGLKEVHLFICWIGTHAEYNKLCNENLQYTINIY